MSSAGLAFIVYLMYQVDTFISVLSFVSVSFSLFSLGGLAIFAIYCGEARGDGAENFKEGIKKVKNSWLGVVFTLVVLNLFTPNSETVKAVAIAYGASEVLQSDTAKDIGKELGDIASKTSQVIQKKLDKELGEN